ncbi:hypothetical protein TCE0_043f15910 [Talaromyces pinophilus]|uniref:Major facilitator superfamily (MFS) profile domain-containing protein n=1 Tax=Talaromyces pinophilus TaxID=128442 RepID=A0A0B8N1R9_TALPI|nr:hypothetical protein TCE0_043f15910 [Talaromyces pinophilus]
MADIFRDSICGQIVRVLFKGRLLYADEQHDFQVPVFERKAFAKISDGETSDDTERCSEASETKIAAVGWYSDDDPDNPQNWSTQKKVFVSSLITLLTFSVYVGSSIVTPANTIIMEMYGVSTQAVSLSLSMYVLGYGIGPLFFSSISEMPRTGRNLPYMTSFFLFLIVTIPAATTSSFPGFIVCRFLQGLMGAPVLATGGASATDLYGFHKVPYAMAAWSSGAFAGPALGPVMAAFAVSNSSWRWPMYELLIAGVFSFIVLSLCLPETSADTILLRRARRLRRLTKNSSLRSESEIKQGGVHILRTMGVYLTTPFRVTLLDPSVAFINVYTALNYSIIYSYFESFPRVYLNVYGFSIDSMGIIFTSLLIACAIGAGIFVAIQFLIYEPYTIKNGIGVPEHRLVPGIYASAIAPVGILIFGWTAKAHIHWIVPTIGIVIFQSAVFIIGSIIFIYLALTYPRYSASLFAANTFMRSAVACAAIHYAQPLFDNLGIGGGCTLLAGLTAVCAVLMVVLWRRLTTAPFVVFR